MKKLFSLLLAGLMIVSFAACSNEKEEGSDLDAYVQEEVVVDNYVNEATGETFYFDSLDSETITITKYDGPDLPHKVEIPAVMHDRKVAGISEMAFYSLSNITEVVIPEGITVIDDMAFAECRQLTSITIPASVEKLGVAAFKGCISLKSITFQAGSKLTAIPTAAFMHCSAMESLTVPGYIATVGDSAFQGCESLKSIVIEEGVKSIGNQAFQNCKALETLKLPASLTEIKGDEESGKNFNFTGCDALYIEGVTVPADANSVAAKYIADLKLQNKPVEPEAGV